MLKNGKWIGLLSLAVAWFFDFLFWMKQPGVSFAIFVLACLIVGLLLAWVEGKRPSKASLVLILPLIFFAGMSFIRVEPFTQAFSYLLALGSMALLAITFLGGRWVLYSIPDHIYSFIKLAASALAGVVLYREKSASQKSVQPAEVRPRPASWGLTFPVVRGVILAAPIVTVFAVLLASADPIFSHRLTDLISLLNLENLPEYIWRLIYILAIAYGLAGVYLYALLHSREEHLIGLEKLWLSPFFGFTEAAIVLASVCGLFAAFVAVQFQYFFGGHTNISLEGFTYAEYARRGFGELLAVALFSLILLMSLNSAARRQTSRQRWGFSALAAILVALVLIILDSAFQRLLLYEQAYGFTRLRTVTHVFMVWLGILLVAALILELVRRVRVFPAAVFLCALGFGVSLNLINVDSLIVRQNVQRARVGLPFDSAYLMGLSTDAVPEMVSLYEDPSLPIGIRLNLSIPLACQSARIKDETQKLPWQSFNLSRSQANQSLQALGSDLASYPVHRDQYGRWSITIDGSDQPCFPGNMAG
jgi:hypothetical protein